MKRSVLFAAVFTALALVGTVGAEEDKAEPQVRLALDLVDGSHLIGIPGFGSVPVQTPYAKMDVPLQQLISIKMGEDLIPQRPQIVVVQRPQSVVTPKLDGPFQVSLGAAQVAELGLVGGKP